MVPVVAAQLHARAPTAPTARPWGWVRACVNEWLATVSTARRQPARVLGFRVKLNPDPNPNPNPVGRIQSHQMSAGAARAPTAWVAVLPGSGFRTLKPPKTPTPCVGCCAPAVVGPWSLHVVERGPGHKRTPTRLDYLALPAREGEHDFRLAVGRTAGDRSGSLALKSLCANGWGFI